MALDKPYLDVPGTIIFDAEQSRKGYWINQFCMSLMKAENRTKFKADERAYLDEWPMTEEQKQAVLARDLNWCMRTGGNIYFLAKIGSTDGKSFQQMAGSMTGMTEEEYQAVLARDLNWCMRTGGNIYFLAKIGSTDGKSFQQMAGSMTGMTEEEYRNMMISGGRSPEGNRYVGEDGDAQAHRQPQGAAGKKAN